MEIEVLNKKRHFNGEIEYSSLNEWNNKFNNGLIHYRSRNYVDPNTGESKAEWVFYHKTFNYTYKYFFIPVKTEAFKKIAVSQKWDVGLAIAIERSNNKQLKQLINKPLF